jgi:UPF0716 protein FxsA
MILLFGLLLPPAELLLLSLVADRFGWLAVVAACAAGVVIGQGLLRWRGRVFLREAQAAVQQDRLPTQAILGGIAWYVAGILFIVPGFITDLLALLILLPPVRKRFLTKYALDAESRLMTMPGAGPYRSSGNVYEGDATIINEEDGNIGEEAARLSDDTGSTPKP